MLNFFRAIANFYWETVERIQDEGFSRRFSLGISIWIIVAGLGFGTIATILLFALYPSNLSIYLLDTLRFLCQVFLVNLDGSQLVAHLLFRAFTLLHLPIVIAVIYQKIRTARLIRGYRRKEKNLIEP
jgi:dolichyl-phosphate-mannose--protein O-mannosyl transferase